MTTQPTPNTKPVTPTQQKVLDALDPQAPRTWWPTGTRTITQIAEAAGLPRSTTRGAVTSLLAAGKVEFFGITCNEAKVYALTGYTEARHRQWSGSAHPQVDVL